MSDESLSLRELHGAKMTAIDPETGEREAIAGFACDNYPDCETCGDLDEDLVESDEGLRGCSDKHGSIRNP